MLICLILSIIGFAEEFVAVIYYGFIRKGWKLPCALTSMLRNIIWLLVSVGVFSSFLDFNKSLSENLIICIFRGLAHTIGVGVGDYCSLIIEPYFDRIILKLSNKGRRKKRWYIQGERK